MAQRLCCKAQSEISTKFAEVQPSRFVYGFPNTAPSTTPTMQGQSAHDRHIANNRKSNTTSPPAKLTLQSARVPDCQRRCSTDRGCTQARPQRCKGCSRYPARLSAWIEGC